MGIMEGGEIGIQWSMKLMKQKTDITLHQLHIGNHWTLK